MATVTKTRNNLISKSWTWTPDDAFASGKSSPINCSYTQVRNTSVVPEYRYKIARSEYATGGYSIDVVQRGWVQGFASFSITHPLVHFGKETQTYTSYGLVSSDVIAPASSLPTNGCDTQARIGFMKKVRSTQRSFQGGVFLGELRETIHMVTRPAQALRRAVSTYSSAAKKAGRRARSASARAKAISGTWLEHSYGWRPLLQDVDDGMKALARIPRIIGDPITYRFATTDKSAFFTQEVVVYSDCWAKHTWTDVSACAVRYKGLVAYENESTADSWQSNWGLTLDNFAPTVWELIPYSFLVDYFSNVGDVIDTSSMGAVTLRWGVRSTVTQSTRLLAKSEMHNVGFSPQSQWHFNKVAYSASATPVTRYNFTRVGLLSVSVGLTDITVKVPGVDNWRKWANIAALAVEKIF
jgi:hypothetical protein